MRNPAFVFLGILLIAFVPGLAFGQAMLGGPLPGPGAPPMPLTPPGAPGGWGVPPPPGCPSIAPKVFGPLSFYAGYLFSDKKGFRYTREPQAESEEPELIYEFPLEGALLATSGTLSLSGNSGIIASGALLIPTKTRGNFREEGVVDTLLTGNLETETSWGVLDAGAFLTFHGAEWGCVQALGGFRWDYTTSKQSISSRDAAGLGTFASVGNNDVTVDAYLPYFGGQVLGASPCSRIVVRVIGFPLVPGDLRFQTSSSGTLTGQPFQTGGSFKHPLKNGLFVETSAEYSMKLPVGLSVGAFGMYNTLRVNTDFDSFIELSQQARSERFKLTRRSWTLGGVISLLF